jgi:hypothetical protein
MATTDVGGQLVVGRSVAGIGDQTWVARSPGPAAGQQLAHPVGATASARAAGAAANSWAAIAIG